jgi:hypothetical protein
MQTQVKRLGQVIASVDDLPLTMRTLQTSEKLPEGMEGLVFKARSKLNRKFRLSVGQRPALIGVVTIAKPVKKT